MFCPSVRHYQKKKKKLHVHVYDNLQNKKIDIFKECSTCIKRGVLCELVTLYTTEKRSKRV